MRTSRCILYTALGTGLCLVYVFLQTEIVKLGYRITTTEKALESCVDKKKALEYKLTSLESPLSIDKNLLTNSDLFEMAKDFKLVKWVPPAQSGAAAGAPANVPVGHPLARRLLALASVFSGKQAQAQTIK